MDKINEAIATYETHLREAERELEKALDAIYDLYGSAKLGEYRKAIGEASGLVQFTIRGTYQLYDNPNIRVAG